MDYQELLYYIDNNLGQEDFQSLKFLCMDLIPHKKLDKMKSCLDLFNELERTGCLEDTNLVILSELLYLIGHNSMLKKLNTNRKNMEEFLQEEQNVSFYRRMLFKLSENVTTEELRQIIFLLNLPSKYTENKGFLDILCHLEKNEDIDEDNLGVLEKAFSNVSPDLLKTINKYKDYRVSKASVRASAASEDDTEELSKTPLSIQAISSTDMASSRDGPGSIKEYTQEIRGLPSEKGLEAENHFSALSLEDQPASQFNNAVNAQDPMLEYPMNRKHRGYCLVISNSYFMKSAERPGTEKDAHDLLTVFTWLGFKVEVYEEQTTSEISNLMNDFQKRDHTDRDCFVCCILTHGHSGAVFGTDNGVININTIVSYFTALNCKSLAGKPKLFFIQACQGQKNQNSHQIEADAVSSPDDKVDTITIPEEADVLIGMSTVDGYSSYRHTREGTWYIQALCSNLIQMVPRGEDILSILTQVNKNVSEKQYIKQDRLLKQMPQPSYTLRKKLIFPKPLTAYKEK